MTAYELGARMGVSQPRISQLERAEREGAISLQSLQRAARALHAELVYALVPVEPLEDIVRCQARLKATVEIAEGSHTVQFLLGRPAPGTEEAKEAYITVLAHHLIDRHGLWR